MKWQKTDFVFQHSRGATTHAAYPTPVALSDSLVRVFYCSRDDQQRGSVFYVDIEVGSNIRVVQENPSPVLAPGKRGLFDDSGVSIGSIVYANGSYWAFYAGWNLAVTVPWRNAIGMARIPDLNLPWQRVSPVPLLDRNPVDPYSMSYPFVYPDGSGWKMWYGSNPHWEGDSKYVPHELHFAEAAEFPLFKPKAGVHIQPRYDKSESAFSKPFVLKEKSLYRMWYCYRGTQYRMGYAESQDGQSFTRLDHLAGIEPSTAGFDSEAVCYGSILDVAGQRYLFYNGNSYGKTGFGVAVLTEDHL